VTSKKLTNVLKIITDCLVQEQIPYSLIGALALGLYGLPKENAQKYFDEIFGVYDKPGGFGL
jgi:hypothetical protein